MFYSELYVSKIGRNRTSTIVVTYFLYLYFLGLSLRNTSKTLDIFDGEKLSPTDIRKWIQRFGSCQSIKLREFLPLS